MAFTGAVLSSMCMVPLVVYNIDSITDYILRGFSKKPKSSESIKDGSVKESLKSCESYF